MNHILKDDTRALLEEEMEVLQDWFDRLYGPRGAKLKIYWKSNGAARREEYILDLHYESTSRSLPFMVPYDTLDIIEYRIAIKKRWVQEMQKQIIAELK